MGDASSSSLMDGRKEKGIERRWDIVGYKTAARRQSDGGRLPKAFVGRRQRGGDEHEAGTSGVEEMLCWQESGSGSRRNNWKSTASLITIRKAQC